MSDLATSEAQPTKFSAGKSKRQVSLRSSLMCLVALVTASACVTVSEHAQLASSDPITSPQAFFAGRTEGRGILRAVFKHPQQFAVHGAGHVAQDGTITLEQTIEQDGKAPRQRQWVLRPAGQNRYVGTLTGARSPVAAEVRGNRMHIRFRMNHGLVAEQWIYVQPGGRTALNRMSVTKFGIRVAAIEETIRREP